MTVVRPISAETTIPEAEGYYLTAHDLFANVHKQYKGLRNVFKKEVDEEHIVTLEALVINILHPLTLVPAVQRQERTCAPPGAVRQRVAILVEDIKTFLSEYKNTNAVYARIDELLRD